MNRLELIKRVIELHNIFCIESTRLNLWDMTKSLWDVNKIDLKTDRYYLVEGLKTESSVNDEKTFSPKVEVRYHLRSKERKDYGDRHNAYYKGYLSTIAFSYDELENPDKYKEELLKSFEESLAKRVEQKEEKTV